MTITGDQKFLKRINRMALVRLIRAQPGLSRADLAGVTGLTKSTVSMLTGELIEEGWLTEDDALATGSIGRRPTPLRLDTRRLALLGVDLNTGRFELAVTSLTGEVITVTERRFEGNDVSHVLNLLGSVIAETVHELKAEGRSVLGLGLAVPGPVHAGTGVLHYSPNLGWRDVPVRQMLAGLLGDHGLGNLPIYLQRRAASAALGEVEFACTEVEEPLLYIHVGMGLGAGVFVSDRLLSGHGGFAGEVGHLQLLPEGPLCTCGRQGCAEALIGLRAMSTALGVTPEEFQVRLAAGDEAARMVSVRAGHFLGVLMHNLWSTFDPAQIVLGGQCCQLGDDYLDAAREGLAELAEKAGLKAPRVSIARFGDHAVSVGATALVLHQIVRPV